MHPNVLMAVLLSRGPLRARGPADRAVGPLAGDPAGRCALETHAVECAHGCTAPTRPPRARAALWACGSTEARAAGPARPGPHVARVAQVGGILHVAPARSGPQGIAAAGVLNRVRGLARWGPQGADLWQFPAVGNARCRALKLCKNAPVPLPAGPEMGKLETDWGPAGGAMPGRLRAVRLGLQRGRHVRPGWRSGGALGRPAARITTTHARGLPESVCGGLGREASPGAGAAAGRRAVGLARIPGAPARLRAA
jgi:hypothetical protein